MHRTRDDSMKGFTASTPRKLREVEIYRSQIISVVCMSLLQDILQRCMVLQRTITNKIFCVHKGKAADTLLKSHVLYSRILHYFFEKK